MNMGNSEIEVVFSKQLINSPEDYLNKINGLRWCGYPPGTCRIMGIRYTPLGVKRNGDWDGEYGQMFIMFDSLVSFWNGTMNYLSERHDWNQVYRQDTSSWDTTLPTMYEYADFSALKRVPKRGFKTLMRHLMYRKQATDGSAN